MVAEEKTICLRWSFSFWFAVAAGGVFLAAKGLYLLLPPPPFLIIILVGGVLSVYAASCVVSLIFAVEEWARMSGRALAPLGINMLTVVLFVAALQIPPPPPEWNFERHYEQRMEVVRDVHNGLMNVPESTHRRLLAVPSSYGRVSHGGNEVVVHPCGEDYFILFFLYRGVLDNFAGFLYVPEGCDQADFAQDLEGDAFLIVEEMAPNWFFVAHS